ncbi:PAS domain S-box protein [Gramella sp. BOM4]|nr:PAS domain S-box protein [Christiangramia bathymodioli]
MENAQQSGMNILANSPVAFYTCNLKGEITFYNKAATELWGREPKPKEKWCGSWKCWYPDNEQLPAEDHPAYKAIKDGDFQEKSKLRIERPDHSFRTVLFIPQAEYDEANNLKGSHFFLIDTGDCVTEQLKNATLSAIVESSDDAIISKDLNGTITGWNSGAERIFGYSEAEALGRSITLIIPDSRLKEEENIIFRLKNGEKIEHFETLRINKAGTLIPLSLSISPIKDPNGKVVGASKVARDISERLQSFEKQVILSSIVESSDDAIISKDLEGTIMSWNRGAQQIFGYSEEEAVGSSITMLIPEEKLSEESLILSKIRNGEKIDHFETVRKHKSGREIQVSITVSPLKNHNGKIIGASKVARDISIQVKSQKALKKYNENLQILNSVSRTISENLNFRQIIQRVINITTKLTESELGVIFYKNINAEETKKKFLAFTQSENEDDEAKVFELQESLYDVLESRQILLIHDIEKEDKKVNPFYRKLKEKLDYKSYMIVPVMAKNGVLSGFFFFGHTQKEHFTSENSLLIGNIAAHTASSLQNSYLFERVKSLSEKKDEFIALASHELKTPLTSLKGYLQMLEKMNANETTGIFMKKTLEQVERLNSLIEDLLDMTRLETGKLDFEDDLFDLKELLAETIYTCNFSSPEHEIIHELGSSPVMIQGDQHRIEQVVTNLISNAIKYSPHADRIEVKLEVEEKNICIRVRDYGIGLSEADQKNLFERFYRADNSRGINGLGIGLYISKQIIDRHNGCIGVNSKCGEGSEFYVTLPKPKATWLSAKKEKRKE